MPQSIYDILDDASQVEVIGSLIERHALSATAFDVLSRIQYDIAEGTMSIESLSDELEKQLSLSKEMVGKLREDFFKTLLLPLASLVPSIASVAQTAQTPAAPVSTTPEKFIHEQLAANGLQMPSPLLQDRFEKILRDFLLKKQSREQVLEQLGRPAKVGGLELDAQASAQLLDAIGEQAKSVSFEVPGTSRFLSPLVGRPVKETLPPSLDTSSRISSFPAVVKPALPMRPPTPPPFDPVLLTHEDEAEVTAHARKAATMPTQEKTLEDLKKEREAYVAKRAERFLTPTPVSPPSPRPSPVVAPAPSYAPMSPQPPKPPSPSALPPLSQTKPRVQDVATPRRIIGPLDELRQMTLEDFRRSGARAQDAAEKVRETLHVLEVEAYAKRLEAVAAWRQSPLMQLYTALLAEAMSHGKPVASVLAAHTQAGESTLTAEEVQALLSLNASLRI